MSIERAAIDLVVGTRPNIVKAAPLLHVLARAEWCRPRLVFLAQHTQDAMTTQTFEDLAVVGDKIVRVDIHSTTAGMRFGEMIEGYSQLVQSSRPSLTVVFGDVDATFAATYAAKREHVPVAHVEAGLRSGDMRMPEEINRRLVDGVCDLYFTTMESGTRNLLSEGVRGGDIHFCGNLMIDAMMDVLEREPELELRRLLNGFGLAAQDYAVATFHRPSNVDSIEHLQRMIDVLAVASSHIPVVFPVHPRSAAALERHGLQVGTGRIHAVPPMRYRDFMALLSRCRLALTDSGGLQEETSALGIPCLTFRENTERPETITLGTNRLVAPEEADAEIRKALAAPKPTRRAIPGWDGCAAPRIAAVIKSWLVANSLVLERAGHVDQV